MNYAKQSSYATLSSFNVVGSAAYGVQQNAQGLPAVRQVEVIPVFGMNGYQTLAAPGQPNPSGHFQLSSAYPAHGLRF